MIIQAILTNLVSHSRFGNLANKLNSYIIYPSNKAYQQLLRYFKMTSMCNVCCKNFTKVLRPQIGCESNTCDFVACRECIQTYVSTQNQWPACMQCKHAWSYEYCVKNMSSAFVKNTLSGVIEENVYTSDAIHVAIDKAVRKVNIANTMNECDNDLNDAFKYTRSIQKKSDNIYYFINEIDMHSRNIIDNNLGDDNTKIKCTRIHKVANKCLDEIESLEERLASMRETMRNIRDTSKDACDILDNENNALDKHIQCPSIGCAGRVNMSTTCKCTSCNQKICEHCETVIDEDTTDHVCDKEVLATLKFLKQDTKECPSCSTRIHKISGCDQMWCTKCHKAFSWERGTVDDGNIHNPHYYDHMFEHQAPARNEDEGNDFADENNNLDTIDRLQCPNNLDIDLFPLDVFDDIVWHFIDNNIPTPGVIPETWPSLKHDFGSTIYMLKDFGVSLDNKIEDLDREIETVSNTNHLSYKFVKGDISEDSFKKILGTNYIVRLHREECKDIMIVLLQFVTQTLRAIITGYMYLHGNAYIEHLCETFKQFPQLVKTMDDRLAELSAVYNQKTPYISFTPHGLAIKQIKKSFKTIKTMVKYV